MYTETDAGRQTRRWARCLAYIEQGDIYELSSCISLTWQIITMRHVLDEK